MSDFVTVFVELAVVIGALVLMGSLIWSAEKQEFQGNNSLAPARTPRSRGRVVPKAARRPSAAGTRIRGPVPAGRH